MPSKRSPKRPYTHSGASSRAHSALHQLLLEPLSTKIDQPVRLPKVFLNPSIQVISAVSKIQIQVQKTNTCSPEAAPRSPRHSLRTGPTPRTTGLSQSCLLSRHLPSGSKPVCMSLLSPRLPSKGLTHCSDRGHVGHPRPHARPGSASPRSGAWALGPAQAPLTPLMSLKCLAWAPASPTPMPKVGWERAEQGSCQLSSAGPWEGRHHVAQTHPGAQPGTRSRPPASPSPPPQGPSQNQSIRTPAGWESQVGPGTRIFKQLPRRL